MLPQLEAEQQLRAIEASLVPHIQPDAAKRVIERHKRTLQPPEKKEQQSVSGQLLDAFRGVGFPVVQEEAPKPTRKRRVKPGQDKR